MPDSQNPFGLWSNPVLAAGLLTAWIALALVFAGEPQVDLAVAGAFFDPELCAATAANGHCRGFPAASAGLPNLIRDALHYLPVGIGIVLVALAVLDARDGARWRDAALRLKLVLVGALVAGPGLIVNGILKEYWGRPRPWMTDQFGGWMAFVEAGAIEGMCAGNCSFVSGEGAGGGWLVCLTVLFPPELRRAAFLVLFAIGATMAGLRVAFGAHYLSDAVLAFLLSITVFVCLAALAQWSAVRRRPAASG